MRIGIYSGSFNPVHFGHVGLAKWVIENTDLDELWLLVSPNNPLKDAKILAPEQERLEGVREAIKDIPGLGTLQKNHGEISFIIMPADAVVTINEYGQVYQGENKCSLGFDPSGISEDGTGLIHGMFAIMDDNEISFELFKAVKKLMKAECRISRGWHIGKEAEDLYGRLRFICIGLNEPESFDFRIIKQ